MISVDTKKKEQIGDFKNNGEEWQPEGQPEEVRAKDFLDKRLGKVVPYGLYDQTLKEGGTISRHIICSGQLFAQFFRSHPEELPEAQRGQLQAQQAVRRLILSVPGPELV